MPLPNPGSAWKYAKYLIRGAEYAVPVGYAYIEGLLSNHEPVSDPAWMRVVVEWTKLQPAGTSDDKAQFKVDLVNITGGSVDGTWTAGDWTTVSAAFNTYLGALRANMSASCVFTGFKAYQMRFDPLDPGPGARKGSGHSAFAETGPPRFTTAYAFAGSGTAGLPYQVSGAVTLRTGIPRHWGRIYLPTPSTNSIDTNGRVGSAYRIATANATKALASTLSDAEFLPVIPMTDLGKQAFHGLLGVSEYVCDDIPDIQRRRRPRQAAARTVGV